MTVAVVSAHWAGILVIPRQGEVWNGLDRGKIIRNECDAKETIFGIFPIIFRNIPNMLFLNNSGWRTSVF